MTQQAAYAVQCWHCLAEFDAGDSVWCSCSASHPTKLCPFCLACFCSASPAYKEAFWQGAPDSIRAERDTLSSKRMLLGDLLVDSKRITTDQLVAALRRQAASGEKLGVCLVRMGFLKQDELEGFLGHQRAPVSLDLGHRHIDPALARKVGLDACLRHRMLPLEVDVLKGRRMILTAMSDATDVAGIDLVQSTLSGQVLAGVAGEAEILEALARLFPDHVQREASGGPKGPAPGVRLLERAVRSRASHLELELGPVGGRVCQRIDGVLYRLQETGTRLEPRHLEDILAWSSQAAAQGARHPALDVEGQAWEMRVQLLQGVDRTAMTVRIHHPEEPLRSLESTSLTAVERGTLQQAMNAPRGLVILAGPSHSGTEHTFWGLVNAARREGRQVLTHGAAQIHPDPEVRDDVSALGASLDDPRARAALPGDPESVLFLFASHRPDVLAAGVDEAQRRLVVLRLRARDASQALHALRPSGVDSRHLAPLLLLSMGQRCVRRICDRCFAPAGLSPRTLQRFGLSAGECAGIHPLRGEGCDACRPSPGYRGRETLLELHPITPPIRARLAAGGELPPGPPDGVGLRSLRQTCLELVARGLTTIEEFQKLNLPASPLPEAESWRVAL